MGQIHKKYQLAYLETNQIGRFHELKLPINTDYDYGYYYAKSETFDTEELAIQYALENNEWHHKDFIIIPIYYITNYDGE